ncbi:hypothetical protein ACFWIJ_06905 [Streptomyces sp. NPDC127079]
MLELQVRERRTADVADSVEETTDSVDTATGARGEHLCMTIR